MSPDARAAVVARSDRESRQDLALALVQVIDAFCRGMAPHDVIATLQCRGVLGGDASRAVDLWCHLSHSAKSCESAEAATPGSILPSR